MLAVPDAAVGAPRPPGGPRQTQRRSVVGGVPRVVSMLAFAIVLGWAWQQSGMSEVGKLWQNRHRAADYVLGQRLDETTLRTRRAQAARDVRTAMQASARAEIEREHLARGDAVPGVMELMRLCQERAEQALAAMPAGQFEALVERRLLEEGVDGGRRGGFFPPELAPIKLFGDPNDLGTLAAPVSWIVGTADALGGPAARGVRWTVSAVSGEGYTGGLFETIAIAIWGTLLAVLLALPMSLFGSTRSLHLLAPGRSVPRGVARLASKFSIRRSFDIARGFNEVVLAMILVAVLGLGPLAGVIALLIHTYGVLGKVFADAIETIDRNQVEGVLSTGATPVQVISFAVLPQIMPYVASQSLLRFESNVRGATILGVVGAGGIGQKLMDKFGAYEFQEVCTMMILIIIAVSLIDFACARVVRRFT
jgi:phosphonate transport system permease protein